MYGTAYYYMPVDRITALPNNLSGRYRLRITTNHWTIDHWSSSAIDVFGCLICEEIVVDTQSRLLVADKVCDLC